MKKETHMIKVYQIQLSNAEVDAINRGEQSLKSKAYFGRLFHRTFKPEYFVYYDHVASVDADNMETAFRLMNLWEDESKIQKHARCSSMSVGDILELEDGSRYRCTSFGFDPL
jgi:hypothetical protein